MVDGLMAQFTPLLAQGTEGGMLHYIIVVIVVLAAVAILYIATRAMGVEIPQWLIQIVMVLVICIVAIIAIKFLWGMM